MVVAADGVMLSYGAPVVCFNLIGQLRHIQDGRI